MTESFEKRTEKASAWEDSLGACMDPASERVRVQVGSTSQFDHLKGQNSARFFADDFRRDLMIRGGTCKEKASADVWEVPEFRCLKTHENTIEII